MLDHRSAGQWNRPDLPSWPASPVVRGTWRDAPQAAITALITACAREDAPIVLPVPIWRVRSKRLPFCPNWLLLEVLAAYSEDADGVIHILLGPGACVALNGRGGHLTSTLDDSLDLSSDDLIDDYLRLFCAVTLGEGGPFMPLESARDLIFSPHADAPMRKSAAQLIEPMKRLHVEGDNDKFYREMLVSYHGSIFRSRFGVYDNGVVEMESDDLVLENIVVVPDVLDGWRVFSHQTQRPVLHSDLKR